MRLRDRRSFTKPEVMIIPMIDIMFFLLVFFMISTLYLEDQPIEEKALIKQAQQENRSNNHFAIVVRADEGIDYGKVVDLLDHFRKAGISRFGLAADAGGK